MADKAAARRVGRAGEFVRIGDQHIKLPRSRVLKIGVLSIDFHDRGLGDVIGFEAHCCKTDFGDCVKRKAGQNCADTDRPTTVWQ
jgi:hypothetical protein